MSRKHNTEHPGRKASNYPARLQARGLTHPPALRSLEELRKIQDARWRRDGSPWPDLWIPADDRRRAELSATYGPRKERDYA